MVGGSKKDKAVKPEFTPINYKCFTLKAGPAYHG